MWHELTRWNSRRATGQESTTQNSRWPTWHELNQLNKLLNIIIIQSLPSESYFRPRSPSISPIRFPSIHHAIPHHPSRYWRRVFRKTLEAFILHRLNRIIIKISPTGLLPTSITPELGLTSFRPRSPSVFSNPPSINPSSYPSIHPPIHHSRPCYAFDIEYAYSERPQRHSGCKLNMVP